jgi:hypothetical protein
MLLQDKELVNMQLIKIDTNVKEKYLLLQNKGYVNGYILRFYGKIIVKNENRTDNTKTLAAFIGRHHSIFSD